MKQAKHFLVGNSWKLVLADLKLNPADVLRLAALPQDLFNRENTTLTPDEYFQLWRGLEMAAEGISLPLYIARSISVENFDPPIFACICSPNLETALQRMAHFKRLIGPMNMSVNNSCKGLELEIECYGVSAGLPDSMEQMEIAFFSYLARLCTRYDVKPLKAYVTKKVENQQELEQAIGCKLTKSDKCGLLFSNEDAQRPFLTANSGMWSYFEQGLNQRLAELDAEASTADKIKSLLLEMLPSGQSSMEEAASRLAISKRTLQRRLSDEGISYQELLKNTRHDLANHYLNKSDMTQGEISFLLGFQDTNSFIRAYSSWAGVSPGQYRMSH